MKTLAVGSSKTVTKVDSVKCLPDCRCNRIIAERIRRTFAKRTPYTGPNDVIPEVQHQQCDDGTEPEKTHDLQEQVP